MKIKTINQIKFSLISLLTFTSFALFYQPVTAKSPRQISRKAAKIQIQFKQKKTTGDRRGRPTRRRGMGSRNDCPATSIPLTALILENQVGKVVEANPTFWLYIPYKSSEIPKGEFVLQDEAHNDVYRTDFPMDKGEGIVGVSLASETSLKTNKIYQWYFKLYCDDSKSSTPIYVRGWVQRVALQPNQQKQLSTVTSPHQRVAFYAQNGILYSALTELAKLRRANPQNKSLARDWLQLLNDIGLKDLSDKPIVEDC
ncbi:MAG: DUF928 domain-containing protein [Rivularia sp. (in: cyanobacteria)]